MNKKTIKLLEENIERYFQDLRVGKSFLGHRKQNHKRKLGKLDFLKISNFCSSKTQLRKYRDFPGGRVAKNLPVNAEDTGSSPGPGRSHMLWSN